MFHQAGCIALVIVVLMSVSAWAQMDAEAEQLARWQLNNADLLVDEGKYLEAVENIDSAYEISRYPKTRSDALLARAMVMATFLDAPMQAVETYKQLGHEFPEFGETASYQSAFLLMQSGETEKAKQGFMTYLKAYPQGRFRFQAEAMLESLGETGALRPEGEQAVEGRPVLRVLLAKKGNRISLFGQGADVCVDGIGCARTMGFQIVNDAPVVNGRRVKQTAFAIHSDKPISVSVDGKKKVVRGDLRITYARKRYMVMNHVNIEDYLRSVVPSESYASWPVETLKAQATAARTYAYYQKLHRTSRAYDVRADTYDQMYGGVDRETARTDRAVRETTGMVLMYGGKPILSQYTANSGGQTADAGAVFGASKPYLVAHADPASLKGKMASWNKSFTSTEIVIALRKIGVDATGLTAIEPAATGPSGRLVKVRLRHARGATVVRTRTTLASSRVLKLPEVLMNVEKRGNKYVFEGHGHGHGVGYSQWGAAELGKRMKSDAILSFYYPQTTIDILWE